MTPRNFMNSINWTEIFRECSEILLLLNVTKKWGMLRQNRNTVHEPLNIPHIQRNQNTVHSRGTLLKQISSCEKLQQIIEQRPSTSPTIIPCLRSLKVFVGTSVLPTVSNFSRYRKTTISSMSYAKKSFAYL